MTTTDDGVGGAREALAALRALAQEPSGGIELLGGFTDEQMDAWPVFVPAACRAVLREVGGVESEEWGTYAFGPVGGEAPGEGYLVVGETGYEGGQLVVGVGAAARADWGPVLRLEPWGDEESVVEAPGFVGWLPEFAGRLAEGEDAWQQPAGASTVLAVPSLRAAAADPGLARLAGPGDSLTDVVDLRELPGYPCTLGWEPYYSTAHATADTSGSEVSFTLVGDGRALLVRSLVSGDFLGRPVERPAVPADAPERAVAELRALAAELPGLVVLEGGCTEAELDDWPVPLPGEVRAVLRELTGVRIAGLEPVELRPGAVADRHSPTLVDMVGGPGSFWPVAWLDRGRDPVSVQVRIDRETGEWGHVVSVPGDAERLAEWPEVSLLAESLPHLLLVLARAARGAARRAATADGGVDGARFASRVRSALHHFLPNTGEPWVFSAPAREWAAAGDALRAAAAAALPGDALVADLREAPIPADLCFHRVRAWGYRTRAERLCFLAGGRIVAVVPVT
ncbi:hypothetical protein ABT263_15075 [Kitasatospora sp. NPDC001603]|uniref:hypothetical protein n=1 Tax=Kitasatospora sp. NPDC001603 TaxID=3154388 RepID=UPI00331C2FCB